MRVLSIAAAAMIVLVMMSSSTDGARGRKSNRIAKGEWGYTGWTDGKRMTLTVTLPNRKESVGTFNLTLGGRGRVFKCR